MRSEPPERVLSQPLVHVPREQRTAVLLLYEVGAPPLTARFDVRVPAIQAELVHRALSVGK